MEMLVPISRQQSIVAKNIALTREYLFVKGRDQQEGPGHRGERTDTEIDRKEKKRSE